MIARRPNLWTGHAGDARDPAALADAGVAAVVDLAAEEPPAVLPRSVIGVRVPILDGRGNDPASLRLAVTAVRTLAQAAVPTLVACSAGRSRGPAVAAMALSLVEDREANEVLEEFTQTGPLDMSPALWSELTTMPFAHAG